MIYWWLSRHLAITYQESNIDKYAEKAGKPVVKQQVKRKTVQSLRLRPAIAEGDYQRLLTKAQDFLTEKKQVKVTVQLRGRQRNNPQQGIDLLNKMAEDLKDYSSVAKPPSAQSLMITLNPKKQK